MGTSDASHMHPPVKPKHAFGVEVNSAPEADMYPGMNSAPEADMNSVMNSAPETDKNYVMNSGMDFGMDFRGSICASGLA